MVRPVDRWWCLQIMEEFVVAFIQGCMYARFYSFVVAVVVTDFA